MSRKKAAAPEVKENIEPSPLDDLMGERFGIYAKDVIQDRAIPDVRDGLKPVQRRILFDMYKTGNTIDKPTKKCAHIVGDVMGKYHPHGDSSIYEAMVHMSQPWAMRMPLIDFQGNNGSIDGDPAAAYRYTEARLSAIAGEMLRDIDEDTVDMELTFDDTLLEPTVLPSRFPNLLVNGSEGIAVGIATNIPPHNLEEVSNAVIYRIDHPECTLDEVLGILSAPDFPTGGEIVKNDSLLDIYRTGRGKCLIKSRYDIVERTDGGSQIIVHEIPYQVNKAQLVRSIDKLRIDRALPSVEEVRDESDKEGLRIVIDVKPGTNPKTVMSYLMSKTQLSSSYSAHLVAIVDGRPTTLNLLSYLDAYIQHQLEVIVRRTRSLLAKRNARLNIVDGLIRAVSILDAVVATIKRSLDKADAKKNIMAEFGFNEAQSEAIVMMPLYKLARTDNDLLMQEKSDLEKEIGGLSALLASQARRETLIKNDLRAIVKKYPSPRRSSFGEEAPVFGKDDKEALIPDETVHLAVTRDGYIKRSSERSFKSSHGLEGAKPGIKEGDAFIAIGTCSVRDYLLIFTSQGNYIYLPVYETKENRWNQEGFHISTMVPTGAGEKLVAVYAVEKNSFRDDLFAVLLTKKGTIKRVALSSFPAVRRSKPITAIKLINGDEVADVAISSGNSSLIIASADAQAVRYNENGIYVTNPRTGGMKAGSFRGSDLVSIIALDPDEKPSKALLLTDRGHLRVIDLLSLPEGERLSKTELLYQSFKSDPNALVYLKKAGAKEPPYPLECLLNDAQRVDVPVNSLSLTPKDLHAKRSDFFKSRERIVAVDDEELVRITPDKKSYLPPKSGSGNPANPPAGEFDIGGFEQISLLDVGDGD